MKVNTVNIDFSKLVVLVLIVVILLQTKCGGNIEPEVITTTKIETKYDTIKVDSLVYVPKWRTKVEVIRNEIPAEVDTLSILKDYYAKYIYIDTLDLDTFGSIIVKDTVTENKIKSRQFYSNIIVPTTTITNTAYKNKRKLYAGVNLSANREVINQIGVGLILKGKNDKLYGIGLGMNQNFQPIITGSLYWKVQIRKPKLNIKLF